MTTLFGNILLFFLTTPTGFVILLVILLYLEYFIAKDIYEGDTMFHRYAKSAIKYIQPKRIKRTKHIPIQTHSSSTKPAKVPIKKPETKEHKNILLTN